MTRKLHSNRQIRSALQQQLRHRQPPIPELRYRVENRRLTPDAGFIYGRARIDVCPAIQKKFGRFEIAVFSGHVQQPRSPEREHTCARSAEVEFRESPIHQCGVGVEVLPQPIKAATEQIQDARCGVLRAAVNWTRVKGCQIR
jgi:hypothetical protein